MHRVLSPRRTAAPHGGGSIAVLVLAVALSLALAACARVEGDAGHVVVRHLAYQPAVADLEAKQYCSEFGRKSVKVRVGPIEPGPLAVQTRASEYRCLPEG